MKQQPLADAMRPKTFDELVGQSHLFGPNGTVRRMLDKGKLSSMIFYGPPGCGKTTAACLIADAAGMPIYKMNAIENGVTDIKNAVNAHKGETVLVYLDEIQYFNKKQQQSLLPFVEDGSILLIASTTGNPWFCCQDALRSRCYTFEFKPVNDNAIITRLCDIIVMQGIRDDQLQKDVLLRIAQNAAGDVRSAINLLELVVDKIRETPEPFCFTVDDLKTLVPAGRGLGFDANADVHYDLLGGLQKSIRGSDPDGALYYLARLLLGGDILSACRRLLVIASEDIGMAMPQAPMITFSCTEAAKQLGMPEAAIPLGHAAVFLATAPKSNSTHVAYSKVETDIKAGLGVDIPTHLRSPLFKGYLYPHDYPNAWVDQQYLPDDMCGKQYYEFGANSTEQRLKAYWQQIKGRNV